MSRGFRFPHTCSIIDARLDDVKGDIKSTLIDLVQDVCPIVSELDAQRYVGSWAEGLYKEVANAFEKVRESNSDMRSAAEEQIQLHIEETAELADQVRRLENRIDELEQLLKEYE